MENLKKLEKLTTKRLLAYYKAERERFQKNKDGLVGFDLLMLRVHLGDVKLMLDKREHVEK